MDTVSDTITTEQKMNNCRIQKPVTVSINSNRVT